MTEHTDREERRHVEHVSSQHRSAGIDDGYSAGDSLGDAVAATDTARPEMPGAQEYRIDLERIRFSSYFARLSDVTQVVPRSGVGPVMHNRLTHSLKVSAVARVIAAQLAGHEARHRAPVRGERR